MWADDIGANLKTGPKFKVSCNGPDIVTITEYDGSSDPDCKGAPKRTETVGHDECVGIQLATNPQVNYFKLQVTEQVSLKDLLK